MPGMAEHHPISVFRLLPSMGDFRTLLIEEPSLVRLIRWQRGIEAEPPTSVTANWIGDPGLRTTKYPSGGVGDPMIARDIVEQVRDDFTKGGSFVPVVIAGVDGDFDLYLVESVTDCLDERRSSKPKGSGRTIKIAIFRPEAIPLDVPAFRIPQSPGAVYWNGWAADLLQKLVGDDLERRLVWSEDKTLKPHPNPMWL
jgi:hypothetical protein